MSSALAPRIVVSCHVPPNAVRKRFEAASKAESLFHYLESNISIVLGGHELGMTETPLLYFASGFPDLLQGLDQFGTGVFQWPEGEGRLELALQEALVRVRSDYFWDAELVNPQGPGAANLIDSPVETTANRGQLFKAVLEATSLVLGHLTSQAPDLRRNPTFDLLYTRHMDFDRRGDSRLGDGA